MTNTEYITAIRKQYNVGIMHICENKPPECFSGFNACLSCKMKATCRLLYKPTMPTIPADKPCLIAAAPDLLEACEYAKKYIESLPLAGFTTGQMENIGVIDSYITAAIAKATGE